MIKVNCWNEYDKLKTVILGNVYDIDRVPSMYDGQDQESFQKIVEQTHEELREFRLILEQHGATVLQPTQPQNYNQAISGNIKRQSPLINMRDFHMAYGEMFFMTHGSYRSRRFQHAWIEDIVNQMIDDDNLVVCANEPNFQENPIWPAAGKEEAWFNAYEREYADKNLFHVASILRHDKTAFVSEHPGSPIGRKWMERWLSQQGITMQTAPSYVGHIDGSNSILNANTIMTMHPDAEVWQAFDNRIYCPVLPERHSWRFDPALVKEVQNPTNWLYEWQGHFQDFSAEANAFSIDPETVCLSFYDRDFYATLKDHGVTAIYVQWRNRGFWGGGLHCITCDIERG